MRNLVLLVALMGFSTGVKAQIGLTFQEYTDLTHIDGVANNQKLVAEADGKRVTCWAQGFEINQILMYAHPVPLTEQDVQDLAARNGFNWNRRKPVKGSQEKEWWNFERRQEPIAGLTPHYSFPVVVEYYDPEVAKRVAATRFPSRTRNLHMFVVPVPGSPSLYSAIGIADDNGSVADLREFAEASLIFKRTEGQSDGIHLGLTRNPNEKTRISPRRCSSVTLLRSLTRNQMELKLKISSEKRR
jgi:hypothetical protein